MDLFDQFAPAWSQTKTNQAVHAYVLYFLGALLGLGVLAFVGFFALKNGFRPNALLVLELFLALVWIAYLLLGEVLLKSAVIAQPETPGQDFSMAFKSAEARWLPALGVALVSSGVSGAVSFVFFAAKPWLGASQALSAAETVIGFVIGLFFAYALFFCMVKKTGTSESIGQGISLLFRKPFEVTLSVLTVSLLTLAAAVGGALVLLVGGGVLVALLGILKSALLHWVILGMFVLILSLVALYGLAYLVVFGTVLLRRYFDQLTETKTRALAPSKPVFNTKTRETTTGHAQKTATRKTGASNKPSKTPTGPKPKSKTGGSRR